MLVIDKIITRVKGDLPIKKAIRSADIIISLLFVCFIITSFYYGFKDKGDTTLISNGLFAFVIFGVSISLILVNKLDKDFLTTKDVEGNFQSVDYNNGAKETDKETFTDIKNILAIMKFWFAFMFDYKDGALTPILVVDTIAFFILLGIYKADVNNEDFQSYCKQYLLVYIPFSVAVFIFLSTP
jgi:uncharacterized membrane protein